MTFDNLNYCYDNVCEFVQGGNIVNLVIARTGSVIAAVSVVCFAIFMLTDFDFGSYLVCMFLAFGFVMMMSGFHAETRKESKAAANTGLVLSGVYAVLVLLVYFAQTSTVRLDSLGDEALRILDYNRFGLFFNYDLLGYGIMSLSTFFIGLGINVKSRTDKWLKLLLIFHGVFFIGCFILPMFGVFSPEMDGAEWIGTLVLEIWCLYFLPVCILSYIHFGGKQDRC